MTSWVAYDAATCEFPIENLPFGVFSRSRSGGEKRIGCAIGDQVLDLSVLARAGLLDCLGYKSREVLTRSGLNEYMGLERQQWRATRDRLQSLLSQSSPMLRDDAALRAEALVPMQQVTMHLPAVIGDYTDFYSSREHATNVGTMFRGADNALQPNWLHLPVGYHGRASSVVVSGTDVVRPCGQLQADREDPKKGSTHGPCQLLDFELEVACFVGGPANPLGVPITMAQAEDRIFGLVLMNDWSARDIQAWEYVPLGPFTSKNLCTSISPWVVSLEALEPFRCSSSAGPIQADPAPLPYLHDPDYAASSYDVTLEVSLQGSGDAQPSVVSRSNLRHLYWNFKQQLVHHAVSGCNMRPGDLLGSGTISGPTSEPPTLGSMLELSWRGSRDVVLSNSNSSATGAVRKFLLDGDVVCFSGAAQGQEYRIGFGSLLGRVLPAGSLPSLPPLPPPAAAAGVAGPYDRLRLFSYWRSSCSWRVRIALALKGLAYEYVPVDLSVLVGNTDKCLPQEYTEVNKMEQVPALEFFDREAGELSTLTQSMAILDFLEEAFPSPSLLPGSALQRRRAREFAECINSGIQPYQNLSLIRQVKVAVLAGESDGRAVDSKELAAATIAKGLRALEALVATMPRSGPFAVGTFEPSMADLCLVPQLYSARRYGLDLEATCPTLAAVGRHCESLDAFREAAPERMPDACWT